MLSKVASLASVLRRDPAEFVARVAAIAEVRVEHLRDRPRYDALEWSEVVDRLADILGATLIAALDEPALHDVERHVVTRLAQLRGGPIHDAHNADMVFGRCCYALTRTLEPRVVIETGVAHGVSTAFILAGLEANGAGELHSIDMPPHNAGADERVGACVPEALRPRWTLHRGMSRHVLPGLVAQQPAIDMFVHDSQHTHRNMSFEFDTVWSKVRVIVADDIEWNAAFAALSRREPALSAAVRQEGKGALFGVVVR